MEPNVSPNDPQKQELVRKRHFAFRINLFFFATFLLFSVLIVRLAILQFVHGEELARQEDQSTVTRNSIAPIRGNIYDVNGYAIAYSTSTQSLFYHYDGGRTKEDVVSLARKLSAIFAEYGDPDKKMSPNDVIKSMDVGYDIFKKSTKQPGYSFVPRRIKAGLSEGELAYILEHRDELEGIEIVEESIRKYDNTKVAVQLVGYLRRFDTAMADRNGLDYYRRIAENKNITQDEKYLLTENVGFDGIELMYQAELRGKNGLKSYPVNAKQEIVGQMSIEPPIKGNNLFLTIHKDIQLITQQAILDRLEFLHSDEAKKVKNVYSPFAKTGFAVAMEVQTGKVVAMASMPDYDPNVWEGGSITTDNWQKIQPYYKNGTIRQVYPDYDDPKEMSKHATSLVPLGSTMKPLTVLLGLNEKLITANEKYRDVGKFTFGRGNGVSVHNSGRRALGTLDAVKAIAVSSNAYMSEMIGNRLYRRDGSKGVDIWDEYMKKFGLGITTGSGLPGESPGVIEYYHELKNGSAQSALVYASFGQQGRYTVLQLAQFTATLANRGKRVKPIFVDKITTFDGETVKSFDEGEIIDEIDIPEAYWNVVQKGMEGVKMQGFENFPYRVAAKTGTSQQQVAGGVLLENSVFIAYAPAENPTLAVAVVVPEGGYGSWGAAPIARKMFDAYDQYFGLTGTPRIPEEQPVGAVDSVND